MSGDPTTVIDPQQFTVPVACHDCEHPIHDGPHEFVLVNEVGRPFMRKCPCTTRTRCATCSGSGMHAGYNLSAACPTCGGSGTDTVPAAPVPSPVPSRPDTKRPRQAVTIYERQHLMGGRDAADIHACLDWIDAQPATDRCPYIVGHPDSTQHCSLAANQGPDLSELGEGWRSLAAGFRIAGTDFDNGMAAALDACADELARLLDREGGTQ